MIDKYRNKLFVLLVPIVIVFGKVLAMIQEISISALFGANYVTDAYYLAVAIPTVLFSGLGTAVSTVFIREYYCELKKSNKVMPLCNNFKNLFICFSIIVLVFILFFSGYLVEFYGHGLSVEGQLLLHKYIECVVFTFPFIASRSIYRSYIQANNSPVMTVAEQSILYLISIPIIYLTFSNSRLLMIGYLLGNIVVTFLYKMFSKRKGYIESLYIDPKAPYLLDAYKTIIPILAGTIVSDINVFIDRTIAASMGDGIVTILNNGYKLSFAFQTIVASGIVTIMYPKFAKSISENNEEHFGNLFRISFKLISIIIIPIVVISCVLSKDIIVLVYGHGNYNSAAVDNTVVAFFCYLLGVAPMCLRHLAENALYAKNKSKVVLKNTVVTVIVNIVLDVLFGHFFGYKGLALATSISLMLSAILILFKTKKNTETSQNGFILIFIIKIILVGFVATIMMLLVYNFMSISVGNLLRLLIVASLGVLIFGVAYTFLLSKDIKEILNVI